MDFKKKKIKSKKDWRLYKNNHQSFFKLLLSNLKDKYMQIKNNKIELTPVKSRLIPGYKIKIEPITNPIIEKNVGIKKV